MNNTCTIYNIYFQSFIHKIVIELFDEIQIAQYTSTQIINLENKT